MHYDFRKPIQLQGSREYFEHAMRCSDTKNDCFVYTMELDSISREEKVVYNQ